MSVSFKVQLNRLLLAAVKTGATGALRRALGKAGSTALRDMRSEASKRIRERKRIKVSYIQDALTLLKPTGLDTAKMEWALVVSAKPVPLVAYPHRQTKKGVSVEVNRGKRTLVKGSFKASMKSGHQGVFKRTGKARLPIKELRGSRPIDALLHQGETEAVMERGGESFEATFLRVLPLELGK